MVAITYSTYQGVVCTKYLKVKVIIKIARLFCSRSKCTCAHSPSPTSSMLKQKWKNLSRYWLIPHYLQQGTFEGCTGCQCQNTGRNSSTALYNMAHCRTHQHQKTTIQEIMLQDWQLCRSGTVKALGDTSDRYKWEVHAAIQQLIREASAVVRWTA